MVDVQSENNLLNAETEIQRKGEGAAFDHGVERGPFPEKVAVELNFER